MKARKKLQYLNTTRNAAERELLRCWRSMKSRYQREAFFVTAQAVAQGGLFEKADHVRLYTLFPELRSRKAVRP